MTVRKIEFKRSYSAVLRNLRFSSSNCVTMTGISSFAQKLNYQYSSLS